MNSGEQHGLLEEAPLNSPPLETLDIAEDEDAESSGTSSFSFAGSVRPGLSGLPRILTNLNGLALVIGLQIGSGIFLAPSVVISKVQSPILAVLVWLLVGVLVWTGAASFIELETRISIDSGLIFPFAGSVLVCGREQLLL
jgi:hypothetical protein